MSFKRELRTLLAGVANRIFTSIEDPAEVARIDRALSEFWMGMKALSRRPWLSPTVRRARRGYRHPARDVPEARGRAA